MCTASGKSGKRPDLHSSKNEGELLRVTRQCRATRQTKEPAAGRELDTREAYTRGDQGRGHERESRQAPPCTESQKVPRGLPQ